VNRNLLSSMKDTKRLSESQENFEKSNGSSCIGIKDPFCWISQGLVGLNGWCSGSSTCSSCGCVISSPSNSKTGSFSVKHLLSIIPLENTYTCKIRRMVIFPCDIIHTDSALMRSFSAGIARNSDTLEWRLLIVAISLFIHGCDAQH